MLRAQKLYGEMELHVSGTTLLLRWGSSLAAVALHCCWDGKVLLLRWQCSARRVAMQCHRSTFFAKYHKFRVS